MASPSDTRRNNPSARSFVLALAMLTTLVVASIAAAYVLPLPPSARMKLTSTAFNSGEAIPVEYTCDGKNISPPLAWSGASAATKSFVLIADDPDAPGGTWTHWIVFDLPANASGLDEGIKKLPGNAKEGLNDFKKIGYGGPCPPGGKQHRYFFKIFAVDVMLGLKPGATRKEVEAAMINHTLAQGELVGLYQRK